MPWRERRAAGPHGGLVLSKAGVLVGDGLGVQHLDGGGDLRAQDQVVFSLGSGGQPRIAAGSRMLLSWSTKWSQTFWPASLASAPPSWYRRQMDHTMGAYRSTWAFQASWSPARARVTRMTDGSSPVGPLPFGWVWRRSCGREGTSAWCGPVVRRPFRVSRTTGLRGRLAHLVLASATTHSRSTMPLAEVPPLSRNSGVSVWVPGPSGITSMAVLVPSNCWFSAMFPGPKV